MKAKSNLPYPVTAFTGREFVRYEWRAVPVGCEAEAQRLADAGILELQDTAVTQETAVSEAEPEPANEPVLAVDLDGMTVRELQAIAREKGISYGGLKKSELIEALRDD